MIVSKVIRRVRASLGAWVSQREAVSASPQSAHAHRIRSGPLTVTGDDLLALTVTIADLADPEVMAAAWR